MGGRGASSTTKRKIKNPSRKSENDPEYIEVIYGDADKSEYEMLDSLDNIKFVKYRLSDSVKAPLETQTKGRVYATVDGDNDVRYISFYNDDGLKYKQIDVKGLKHTIDGEKTLPHTHLGYLHAEGGTFKLNEEETKIVDKVLKYWYNKKR